MNAPARIACIEDDAAFRASLVALLADAGFLCAGAWPSIETARTELAAAQPNLLLLDIDLPGLPGHAAVAELLQRAPAMQIVMLTAHGRDELVFSALRAGAIGYLLKTAGAADIVAAIQEALAGGAPMSPPIARRLVAVFAAAPAPDPAPRDTALAALNDREHRLLRLIASGASDKEAAAQLGLSHASVRKRLHTIYGKLHVRSRTEAALRFRGAAGAP